MWTSNKHYLWNESESDKDVGNYEVHSVEQETMVLS